MTTFSDDYYKMHVTQNAGLLVKDVIPQTWTIKASNSDVKVYKHVEPVTSRNIATDPKYYHLFFS